jgi:sulfatase modifying factor 1
MGHPTMLALGQGNGSNHSRLVVVSPFYMDATEVTVAQFRQHHTAIPQLDGPYWQSFMDESGCTITLEPNVFEQRPAVCTWYQAVAAANCQARGAELPTEAQFEYVAGGLSGKLFVWGDERPACDDAVFAYQQGCPPDGGTAQPKVQLVGPERDPNQRDRLVLSGGVIHDLVGNASEWVRDDWSSQDTACWSSGGVFVDPWCQIDKPAPMPGCGGQCPDNFFVQFYRGGNWIDGDRDAAAANRKDLAPPQELGADRVGFRCVREAAP